MLAIFSILEDIKKYGEEIEVELLIQSNAVNACKDDNNKDMDTIKGIMKRGVKVTICNNSLNGLKIDKKNLLEGAIVVTSGVGELTRKQNDGWAYIKP